MMKLVLIAACCLFFIGCASQDVPIDKQDKTYYAPNMIWLSDVDNGKP